MTEHSLGFQLLLHFPIFILSHLYILPIPPRQVFNIPLVLYLLEHLLFSPKGPALVHHLHIGIGPVLCLPVVRIQFKFLVQSAHIIIEVLRVSQMFVIVDLRLRMKFPVFELSFDSSGSSCSPA